MSKSFLTGREVEQELEYYDMPPKILEDDVHSRVEFDFVWELQKFCLCFIESQKKFPVDNKKYRVDFFINHPIKPIIVEIDGKKWHDTKTDSIRDTRILNKYDNVHSIVRFDASDAYYNPSFCVKFLLDNFGYLFRYNTHPDKNWESHVSDSLKSKLLFHGIYNLDGFDYKLVRVDGYKSYNYPVNFMTAENHSAYHNESDRLYNPPKDLYKRYTFQKTIQVRVMD